MDILGSGLRRLLGAIREQNVPLVLLGAALVAIGLARKLDAADHTPLYSEKLQPGESLQIRLVDPAG